MRTEQDIFNQVYVYASGMTRLAKIVFRDGVGCVYRAPPEDPDCPPCLIGHLLPDGQDLPTLGPISDEEFIPILLRANLLDDEKNEDRRWFLRDLQRCHDNANNLDNMMERLGQFADEYKLTLPG